MIARRLAIALLLVLGAARADDDPSHVLSRGEGGYGGVTPAIFAQRIEDGARKMLVQYPQGAARVVEFDIAYPKSLAEYQSLNGNGILLLVAVTRNEAELPLARAYIESEDGKPVVLQRISSLRSELGEGSSARVAYGRYRQDAFFLVPLTMLAKRPRISCDFAINRSAFVVNDEPLVPADFKAAEPKSRDAPNAAAIKKIVGREYPGFPLSD
jgi:hypothetical protein